MITRLYIASKTTHAEQWRELRDLEGWPISSTWIDEAGIGETKSWSDLWSRCISEAGTADALIIYGEPGEAMKGALVEVGAALLANVPVAVVGDVPGMKNAVNHPSVLGVYPTLDQAIAALKDKTA